MRFCELQEKDVINVADCCFLGNVCDLDIILVDVCLDDAKHKL